VNKEMHIEILRSLRDTVRRKRHEKCRTSSWFQGRIKLFGAPRQ
jgi:hypothetical protein